MKQNQFIDPLLHLLEIKSISTQDEFLPQMEEARHWLIDQLQSMGFKTRILQGKRHAAVFAEREEDPKLPTVLIYGHYDVQPPDPLNEWKTDPFVPIIKKGKIFARGATDDKGQFMIHIMAVKNLIEKNNGRLALNFKFIIEGEEEIGSISVEGLARKYAKNLFKADYLVVSDSEMVAPNQPSIDISLRGIVYAEVFVESSKQDLHSGQFGGVAENPAVVLARIISTLKDKNNKVNIPNFYADVLPPTKEELKDYNALKTTNAKIKKEGGMLSIGGGEEKYSLNERRWSRPTLDVNGIISGYIGEGSKTIIPARASAKISMRLVPNQNPKLIWAEFEKFVKEISPNTVKVRVISHSDALPYKAPTTDPVFGLVKQSLKNAFGKAAVFQGVGGSIGFVPVVAKALNIPCILLGFGLPDENLHSPNEHFSIDNYLKGIEAMSDFYQKLGRDKTEP